MVTARHRRTKENYMSETVFESNNFRKFSGMPVSGYGGLFQSHNLRLGVGFKYDRDSHIRRKIVKNFEGPTVHFWGCR